MPRMDNTNFLQSLRVPNAVVYNWVTFEQRDVRFVDPLRAIVDLLEIKDDRIQRHLGVAQKVSTEDDGHTISPFAGLMDDWCRSTERRKSCAQRLRDLIENVIVFVMIRSDNPDAKSMLVHAPGARERHGWIALGFGRLRHQDLGPTRSPIGCQPLTILLRKVNFPQYYCHRIDCARCSIDCLGRHLFITHLNTQWASHIAYVI